MEPVRRCAEVFQNMDRYTRILEKLPAEYADLRFLEQKEREVALRTDSTDAREERLAKGCCSSSIP